MKLIIGEPHGEIIGAHIVGSEATELIADDQPLVVTRTFSKAYGMAGMRVA